VNKIKMIAAFIPVIFLVACSGSESGARDAVLAQLKDPESAKFGEFTEINDELACLTVNAKNSMGGYVGDQQAFLKKKGGEWDFWFTQEVSHQQCIDLWPTIADQ